MRIANKFSRRRLSLLWLPALLLVVVAFGIGMVNRSTSATDSSAAIVDNDGVLAYGDSTYGGGAYAVLGCYDGSGGLTNNCPADINIPATLNGHDVVEIANSAFSGKNGVDRLTTNDGLRYVGASAFADSAFTELNFAATVETFGGQAFFKMGGYKGVHLTINFLNPNPAPASFGSDIMGWTWDNINSLTINIPPGAATWQAYLDAMQPHDRNMWTQVVTEAYTPAFPVIIVKKGDRAWCVPAQYGSTCWNNDGALPNIELYQSGSPVSPPPSVSDVSGYILAYSGLADGTYQVYTNAVYAGVDLVVSSGQSTSVVVNFAAQLAVSAGGTQSSPLDFGSVTGTPYSVTPITVRLTNVSTFATATNVNINTSYTCSYYGPFCTDISGNVGDLAPGAFIDFQVFPKNNLSFGVYGTPTSGSQVAEIYADGTSHLNLWGALTILNPYRMAITGQDVRLTFQSSNHYNLNLGTASTSGGTAMAYSLRIYNDGDVPTGDIEYYCYPPSQSYWYATYTDMTLGGQGCDALYATPAVIPSIPVGGYYDLALSTLNGLSEGDKFSQIIIGNNDLGRSEVDVRQRVIGAYGISITSDAAHPSFVSGTTYDLADEYDDYDPANVRLPLIITNIGSQPTGDMEVFCDYIFDDCGSWVFPTSTIPSLAPGASTTIYYGPRGGLTAGDYYINLALRGPNWGDYDYSQSLNFRVLSCANDACLDLEVNDSDDPEILLPDLMEGFAAGDGATRVKLTNTGHSPISNLSLNLPSGEFVLSGTSSCVSLAPGASCEFTITPRAGLIRGRYTGQLSLSYGLAQVKFRDIVLVVTPFVPNTPPVIPGPPNTGTPMEQFGITPQTYTLCGLALLVVIAGLWIAKSRRARRP